MRRLFRRLVLLLPILGTLSAIAVGLARQAWPSDDFWRARGGWILAAILVSAVVPLVQASISELGEKKRRKELEREAKVRGLLVAVLVYVVRHCNAPWDLTGIQAFLVAGWPWNRHQVRIAKVRMQTATESGVRWKKEKGVIGVCWKTRHVQTVHLDEPPFSELKNASAADWALVSADQRFGLTYEDYLAIGDKFGTIVAVPVTRAGSYIGCVTLDLPPGVRLDHPERAEEFLVYTADLVSQLREV